MQARKRIVADRTLGNDLLAGSNASGLSTSTVATSALSNKSRDLRSCALAGLYGFRRLAFGIPSFSRSPSDAGQFVPAFATHRLKSDQRTQMSDPMAAQQPFQPPRR